MLRPRLHHSAGASFRPERGGQPTHPGGHVALYPMCSPNRRRERRADVVEMLKAVYRLQDVIDYSGLEPDEVFLEGTGAMVLDHLARVAYTARSNSRAVTAACWPGRRAQAPA